MARLEDAALLRGDARFLDDLSAPDALFAVVVRSPFARGMLRPLVLDAAQSMPGVRLVLTAADLEGPGLAHLPLDVPPPAGAVPRNWVPPCQPVLASEAVRFVGEAVAFVVADSAASAQDAAESIAVEVEEEPPVIGFPAAFGSGMAVHPAFPQNEVLAFERGDAAATAHVFANAARHESLVLSGPRVIASPLEPRSCLARLDGGRLVLEVGTQRPYGMRDLLARLFGLDPVDVIVRVPQTGGGFGLKNGLYPEYVLCLQAARLLGQPIKWVAGRQESFLCDNQARDNHFQLEAALDDEGRLTGIRARRRVDLGAYVAPRSMVPVDNGTTHLTGVYRVAAAHVNTSAYLTNTACTSSYRGAGRPEHVYACERLVDVIARRLGEDPVAFRRRNLAPPDAEGLTALGSDYRGLDFARLLNRALTILGDPSAPQGLLLGRGTCLFIEDLHGSPRPAPATIVAQEGKLCILPGTVSTGQGHETAMRQIAADVLGLKPGDLEFRQGDSEAIPLGLGTAASWSITLGGSSVLLAARAAIEEGGRVLAALPEAAGRAITFRNGIFGISGTNLTLSWADVVSLAPDFRASATFEGCGETTPAACHACAVAVDPDTGAVQILRYAVAQECGRLINPAIAQGQIQGGVAQGIGEAWMEDLAYNTDTGQPLAASYLDYAMPRAGDLPPIVCEFIDAGPDQTNPLGVKGIGEAGATGAIAAFANAVMDALHPLGIEHLDIPLTPMRVRAAIAGAARQS